MRLPRRSERVAGAVLLVIAALAASCSGSGKLDGSALQEAILDVAQVDAPALAAERAIGTRRVALLLDDAAAGAPDRVRQAAAAVLEAGLALDYWIPVARSPALADAHPEWMASLQGHTEWRRLFPAAPQAGPGEVIKCWPWVPILYAESFAAQRDRIVALIGALPQPEAVFLDGLQGGPSACGCGNILCRWTADYGPVLTATPLGDDAAARFVREVGKWLPAVLVVPVWAPECEAQDAAHDGACAGVGCYEGLCWKAWTRQLEPIVAEDPRNPTAWVGALLLEKTFERPRQPEDWVAQALASFETIPAKHGKTGVPPRQLMAIIEGERTAGGALPASFAAARDAGVRSVIVARAPLDQSWQPRLHKVASPQGE